MLILQYTVQKNKQYVMFLRTCAELKVVKTWDLNVVCTVHDVIFN